MTSIFLWIFSHYKSKDQVKAFQRSAIGQFFSEQGVFTRTLRAFFFFMLNEFWRSKQRPNVSTTPVSKMFFQKNKRGFFALSHLFGGRWQVPRHRGSSQGGLVPERAFSSFLHFSSIKSLIIHSSIIIYQFILAHSRRGSQGNQRLLKAKNHAFSSKWKRKKTAVARAIDSTLRPGEGNLKWETDRTSCFESCRPQLPVFLIFSLLLKENLKTLSDRDPLKLDIVSSWLVRESPD